MQTIGFERHDHAGCRRGALEAAEAHCERDGLRLTPVRRRVLEILLEEHRALGAYEILEVLAREGQSAQPPVAYRALDFLVRAGVAHKIERLNSYVACAHPGEGHAPAFMICRACEAVAETSSEPSRGPLGRAAREAGFLIERTVIEAEGLCPRCRETEAP